MKRIISLAITILMLVSLAACQKAPIKDAEGSPAPTEAPKATEQPTTAPTDPADPTDVPTDAPTAPPEITPEPTEVPNAEPLGASDVKSVFSSSAGTNYILFADGSLWSWGRNEYGQAGSGTTSLVRFPVKIAEGLTPIFVGETVFALGSDGMLWGWGRNDGGDLGLGDTTDRTKPEEIMPFVKKIVRAYDGWYAVTEGGELYHWGFNSWDDTLSDEEKAAACTPKAVLKNIVAFDGAYAITSGGELLRKQYGDEGYSHVADGVRNILANGIIRVIEGTNGRLYALDYNNNKVEICSSYRSVTISDSAAYILMNNGSLYCYYVNSFDGIREIPEDQLNKLIFIMDGVGEFYADDYIDEDWGYYYRFALKKNGELWAWGLWDNSVLGKNADADVDIPELVAKDVKTVSTNGYNTYIIKKDGTLWATGSDSVFGPRDTDESRSFGFVKIPFEAKITKVFNLLRMEFVDGDEYDWTELYASTYAVDGNGRIWAWGWNGEGLLGVLSNEEEVTAPLPVVKEMNNE
ncbi:MAG: hypothetical protein J5854_06325 [Clostridia bacterium]|nr:hypothetical protein [Clostridia bacterium]